MLKTRFKFLANWRIQKNGQIFNWKFQEESPTLFTIIFPCKCKKKLSIFFWNIEHSKLSKIQKKNTDKNFILKHIVYNRYDFRSEKS